MFQAGWANLRVQSLRRVSLGRRKERAGLGKETEAGPAGAGRARDGVRAWRAWGHSRARDTDFAWRGVGGVGGDAGGLESGGVDLNGPWLSAYWGSAGSRLEWERGRWDLV